ncbi:hypothetical protein BD310DRAFT_930810 [Dichomitus squalens]|uniref:Uncharacterized protein n=1 Tax=Dichomitus squalens TaxID=114155 RepID=A0A4V2K7M1_9APHY|nr:hypothetical protein BD310DRAFT_930810 [Dichomitus squalens]
MMRPPPLDLLPDRLQVPVRHRRRLVDGRCVLQRADSHPRLQDVPIQRLDRRRRVLVPPRQVPVFHPVGVAVASLAPYASRAGGLFVHEQCLTSPTACGRGAGGSHDSGSRGPPAPLAPRSQDILVYCGR